jgi:hypothetical protein
MHPPAFLLVDCAHGIASRALKLIFALKFPPSEDVPLWAMRAGHHIYLASRASSYPLHPDCLDLLLSGQGTIYQFLLLRFSSPLNLGTRFL